MATAEKSGKHPYISGTGGITNALNQFKRAFPAKVTAETLKKLAIAPNNETYVINILRFINAIDADGNRTDSAASVFAKHDLGEFQKGFRNMLKDAYEDLFSLHGDAAWTLDANKLISFFRSSDKTSDIVGRRQTSTFQTLASFAGYGEIPTAKTIVAAKPAAKKKKAAESPAPAKSSTDRAASSAKTGANVQQNPAGRDVGLTVRIEVNLPPAGDQETYDRIFRSIRENLLNAT